MAVIKDAMVDARLCKSRVSAVVILLPPHLPLPCVKISPRALVPVQQDLLLGGRLCLTSRARAAIYSCKPKSVASLLRGFSVGSQIRQGVPTTFPLCRSVFNTPEQSPGRSKR